MATNLSSNSNISTSKMQEELRGADEKTPEKYAHIISTLPKKKGWANDQYRYQGFWYSGFLLNAVMSVQDNFKARPSDVLITSSPKSGTTWLKALVFALLNRNLDDPTSNHLMLTSNPHEYIPFLEIQLYAKKQIPNLDVMPSPRLLATHIPYSSLPESARDSGCRIVYISRDIKDVFVSLWHFVNKVRHDMKEEISLEKAFESYCDGVSIYGPIWDHQLEYLKASVVRPQCVMFLRYEEMMEDPLSEVRRLAQFLGRPFSEEEEKGGVVEEIVKVCSFESLKDLQVNKVGELQLEMMKMKNQLFFRRGVVGDSKRWLTPEMIGRLDGLTESMMDTFGSPTI
ncbi:Cytosolic sulfotransferase 17 [Acorus calamus]|uniref:Sulfotransferase n=1 Tax=Acorus calamus TaxID=4465 RepID=A0AAV9D575_ACOCL|nr:Cytosolic sulfotransferase 17 [Acorus calamus]